MLFLTLHKQAHSQIHTQNPAFARNCCYFHLLVVYHVFLASFREKLSESGASYQSAVGPRTPRSKTTATKSTTPKKLISSQFSSHSGAVFIFLPTTTPSHHSSGFCFLIYSLLLFFSSHQNQIIVMIQSGKAFRDGVSCWTLLPGPFQGQNGLPIHGTTVILFSVPKFQRRFAGHTFQKELLPSQIHVRSSSSQTQTRS